jgi:hypothetical protein
MDVSGEKREERKRGKRGSGKREEGKWEEARGEVRSGKWEEGRGEGRGARGEGRGARGEGRGEKIIINTKESRKKETENLFALIMAPSSEDSRASHGVPTVASVGHRIERESGRSSGRHL